MTTTPLIIQSVISGSFFLIGTLFLVLPIWGIKDLSNINFIKDYQVIVSIIFLGLSYVFGSFFKNFINMIFPRLVKLLRRNTKTKNKYVFNRTEMLIKVNQYGSNSLIELLSSRSRSLSFYQTLAFGIPYFGIGFSFWMFWKDSDLYNLIFAGVTIVIGIIFYLIYKRKRSSQFEFENTLASMIDNHIKKKK